MVRAAKRQRVDAHPSRAVEVAAAGVVAGTLQFEQTGGQMSESIAADDCRAPGRFANLAVEGQRDFSGGAGAVSEMPAGFSEVGAHRGSPAAQQIKTGVVVLDQLETPGSHAADVLADGFERLGQARIERRVAGAATGPEAGGRRNLGGGVQGAQPDARTDALTFHDRGELRHIGEAGIAALPRTGGVGQRPAVIDHHKGPVWPGWSEFRHQAGIALDGRG